MNSLFNCDNPDWLDWLCGILLLLALAAGLLHKEPAPKPPPPPTKVACPDFPPVDGAGRPAICDEK